MFIIFMRVQTIKVGVLLEKYEANLQRRGDIERITMIFFETLKLLFIRFRVK